MTANLLQNTREECKYSWTKPETVVDDALAEQIRLNFRTLPSYEKTVFDNVFMKHFSLERHELLKCRWAVYKKHLEERLHLPFQFPSNRDLHFYNYAIRLMPYLSSFRNTNHGLKLKPGPGVDQIGQLPVPNDVLQGRNKQKVNPKLKNTHFNNKYKSKSAKKEFVEKK